MAIGTKSKNPQIGQATPNALKSISIAKILSLTVMQETDLRLKDI